MNTQPTHDPRLAFSLRVSPPAAAPPSIAREWWLALAVATAAMALYWASLLPTVGFVDAPRYCAFVHQNYLGVASIDHPLFILLAKPFSWLPWGDLGYRTNLASAFFGALAAGLTTLLVLRNTGNRYGGVVAGLAFATSYDLWWLSTEAEVYSLAVALLFAALLFLIGRPAGRTPAPGRAFFLAGLAVVNHQAAIFALPPMALYLWRLSPAEDRRRALLTATGALTLGFAPYVLLFLGHGVADGWSPTIHQMTGGEFQSALLAPLGLRGYARVLGFLIVITGYQFYPFHTLVWIIGALHLWRRDPRRTLLLGGVAGLNALFVVLYDVPDRIFFYLPSFAICALFLGEGLALVDRTTRRGNRWARRLLLVMLTLPVFGKMLHYRLAADFIRVWLGGETALFDRIEAEASGDFPLILPRIPGRDDLAYYINPDKKGIRAAEKYRHLLERAPAGALVVDDWYHGYAVMHDYYQGIYGVRPDVDVVRWFERWGGTPAERDAKATEIIAALESGRPVLVATDQYPSSTLRDRLEDCGHHLEAFEALEGSALVRPARGRSPLDHRDRP